jgi:hypothetical protein
MPTKIRHHNPAGLPRNPAFSQGVSVEGPARTIYVGGQPPATMPQMHRALALRIEADRQRNGRLIRRLREALQASLLLLLLLEILAWLFSIAGSKRERPAASDAGVRTPASSLPCVPDRATPPRSRPRSRQSWPPPAPPHRLRAAGHRPAHGHCLASRHRHPQRRPLRRLRPGRRAAHRPAPAAAPAPKHCGHLPAATCRACKDLVGHVGHRVALTNQLRAHLQLPCPLRSVCSTTSTAPSACDF